jgi:hypothetical protein
VGECSANLTTGHGWDVRIVVIEIGRRGRVWQVMVFRKGTASQVLMMIMVGCRRARTKSETRERLEGRTHTQSSAFPRGRAWVRGE